MTQISALPFALRSLCFIAKCEPNGSTSSFGFRWTVTRKEVVISFTVPRSRPLHFILSFRQQLMLLQTCFNSRMARPVERRFRGRGLPSWPISGRLHHAPTITASQSPQRAESAGESCYGPFVLFINNDRFIYIEEYDEDRPALAAREARAQRSGSGSRVVGRLSLAVSLAIEKASVVHVVQHEQPLLLATMQPVVHQLEDVGSGIQSPGDADAVGNVAVALLEPGGVAGMHPEHPRLRRPLARAVGMLDGELRLASLAVSMLP